MYLLDAADDAVTAAARAGSRGLGDSLVVVGGEGLWNVHVHVDDVGAAIEAGIEAGRPHRVRVTHFAEQVADAAGPPYADPHRAPGRRGRRRARPAPRSSRTPAPSSSRAGPAAARRPASCSRRSPPRGPPRSSCCPTTPTRCASPGSRPAPPRPTSGCGSPSSRPRRRCRGWPRWPCTSPGRSFDQDVLEMTATARHARHGAVTVAARKALTMAGWCEPGDVLGVIEGDFVEIGDDLHARRHRDPRPAGRRWWRAGHPRRPARAPATWPSGPRRGSRTSTRRSTWSSTTAARSATRCCCRWSERGLAT